VTLSRRRLWLFRLLALLLPILALVGLEGTLRIAGYGYSTSFFKEVRYGSKRLVVDNESFSLRFFPAELARWPTSFKFASVKTTNTLRIFILGESAAMGDPQPAFGAGRYLEVLLRRRFPDRTFQVINLGITAINSHVILPIARDCASREGDIWIIYMGNNEMVGPFGAATVFGSRAPPLWLVRLNLMLQRFRFGQLSVSWSRHLGGKSRNTAWGGMQMFLQNQLPPADPRKETVYRNFEANLRDIVRAGLDSGAKVLLNTISVNLKDCPPFASLANTNLPLPDQVQFQKIYGEGRAWEEKGSDLAAAQSFEQAAKLDPTFAELQFRWGECLLRTSNTTARAHYQLACDTDALPFRADTRVNGIIRRVGGEFAKGGLVLADAETELANVSPFGLPGQEAFFEHVHFSFQGNYLLGRLWAVQVERAMPKGTGSTGTNWASQEACERDLGLTPWNRGFVLDSVISRMSHPPLSSQFNNPARLAVLQAELKALQAQQVGTNPVMRSGQELVNAIQRAPGDPFLQEGFANFLEAVGDRKQAASVYKQMLELLPNDFYSKLQLGRLYGELGQAATAEPLLQQATRQRQSVPDAWVELGNVQMMLKKYGEALESYTQGLKLRPQEPAYLCFQANALARLNRNREAIAAYRRAIQIRADQPQTHFELAGLLAAENEVAEAMREYNEAIRLNPQYVVSHINLGVMLFRQNRLDEAIQQFQTALQLDPGNAAAADYLRQTKERRPEKK